MNYQSIISQYNSVNIRNVIIINPKDNTIRAKSSYANYKSQEINFILMQMMNPTNFMNKDFVYDGKMFRVVRADNNAVFGINGNGGVVINKTFQSCIFSVSENHYCSFGVNVQISDRIATSLRQSGL